MRRKIHILSLVLSVGLLTGCGIFPKEEELQKTPIIEAYQEDPFKLTKVKKGNLKAYETIEAVCMNLGEVVYTFTETDLAYKGIYVKQGDSITAGTLIAELNGKTSDGSSNQIYAKNNGVVTFAKSMEDGERSTNGQVVAVVNSSEGYFLSAYTKHWNKYKKGDTVVMKVAGKDFQATIIEAQDLGLPASVRPTDPEEVSEVYFHIADKGAYMLSGDKAETVLLTEDVKNALYIPKSAVTLVNDEEIVYVEDKDGIRSVKKVKTGIETDRYVEIVSGLKEGDSVILE